MVLMSVTFGTACGARPHPPQLSGSRSAVPTVLEISRMLRSSLPHHGKFVHLDLANGRVFRRGYGRYYALGERVFRFDYYRQRRAGARHVLIRTVLWNDQSLFRYDWVAREQEEGRLGSSEVPWFAWPYRLSKVTRNVAIKRSAGNWEIEARFPSTDGKVVFACDHVGHIRKVELKASTEPQRMVFYPNTDGFPTEDLLSFYTVGMSKIQLWQDPRPLSPWTTFDTSAE